MQAVFCFMEMNEELANIYKAQITFSQQHGTSLQLVWSFVQVCNLGTRGSKSFLKNPLLLLPWSLLSAPPLPCSLYSSPLFIFYMLNPCTLSTPRVYMGSTYGKIETSGPGTWSSSKPKLSVWSKINLFWGMNISFLKSDTLTKF